jgi:hypothetical protein
MQDRPPGDFEPPDFLAPEDAEMPSPGEEPPAGGALEAARDRNAPSLMAIPGVVGIAAGRTDAGDDAIVVYLEEPAARERVPDEVEGFPVQAEVTGRIDAY